MQEKSTHSTTTPRRIYIKTFGCQMNDRDSEAVAGLFVAQGYQLTDDYKAADVILVNTCSVRAHAEERAISFLGSLKKLAYSVERIAYSKKVQGDQDLLSAKRYPLNANKVIGLLGCMAKRRGEEIMRRMPHVNLVLGPANIDRIVEYVDELCRGGRLAARGHIIDIEDRARTEEFYEAPYRLEPDSLPAGKAGLPAGKAGAQVVISTGCSNHCTYCVVPSARGEIRPRAPQNIIAEVKRNIKLGVNKITLLGQNVNDYKYAQTDFVDLLKMVSEVEGVKELSFLTSQPKNTTQELFELMAGRANIKKQLHLPFQSGSDRILKAMGRGYTREHYLALAAGYRQIVKGSLGTDIIVGFPGETDEDFDATVDLVKACGFEYAYIFMYSPRPGTAAAKLADDVPLEVKKKRHAQLLKLMRSR